MSTFLPGQPRLSGGDAFTVSIRGASRVNPTLKDKGNGTYECEWLAPVSGPYLISVLLGGEHVAGSPHVAEVANPGVDLSLCKVLAPAGAIASHISASGEDDASVHVTAGLFACFDMTFFDALSRPVIMEPQSLRLSVMPWRSLVDALSTSESTLIGSSARV